MFRLKTINSQGNTAVLFTTLWRAIGSDGIALAMPSHLYQLFGQAAFDKIVIDSLGALLGQNQVVRPQTYAITMPINYHGGNVRIGKNIAHQMIEDDLLLVIKLQRSGQKLYAAAVNLIIIGWQQLLTTS